MSVLSNPSLGPYMGITHDAKRGRYRLLISGAYNALGLIGSEYNGIVVLDDETMQVVADRLFKQASGYNGPDWSQRNAFDRMLTCSPEEFAAIINLSGHRRFDIDPATVPEAAPSLEAA
jgi:PAS domain-containing protein